MMKNSIYGEGYSARRNNVMHLSKRIETATRYLRLVTAASVTT
ncbi:hypothetical protein SAMN05444972_103179 [Marininema halotolerans]|uniref:Uncharacterized protein n=1 Tax=Marininema halotolerans TaxID=1155944 RepID=A0A1I6QJ74_9BACL|nr:hypothetical protein SAMN05444972_103179 [Marininema halotolerans]